MWIKNKEEALIFRTMRTRHHFILRNQDAGSYQRKLTSLSGGVYYIKEVGGPKSASKSKESAKNNANLHFLEKQIWS